MQGIGTGCGTGIGVGCEVGLRGNNIEYKLC